MPSTYADCPRVYALNPGAFVDLLLDNTGITRVGFFSDSTAFDVLGADAGHMERLRWLFHQHHGHTPATQLSRSANFGGSVPGASFLVMGGVVDVEAAQVADNYLPPGHQHTDVGAGWSFQQSAFRGAGLYLILNHNNDNDDTQGCGSDRGYHYVPAAVNQGIAGYSAGTALGGASMIDLDAGVRCRILAASYAGSSPDIYYEVINQPVFCTPDVYVAPTATGTLTATLNQAEGFAALVQTPILADLAGANDLFGVLATSSVVGANPVQIVGAWFESENKKGVQISSFSSGGYKSDTHQANHPDAHYLYAAMGIDVAWIAYGTNDQGAPMSVATYKANILALIDALADEGGITHFILQVQPARSSQNAEFSQYAVALLEIAQADPRCMFLNARLITEEDSGWTTATAATFTSDGTHYNTAGVVAITNAEFAALREAAAMSTQALTYAADTFVWNQATTTNWNGNGVNVVNLNGASKHNTYLRFTGLNLIPAGSTINSASLSLVCNNVNGLGQANMFARRITRAWVEAQATWDAYSTGNNWTAPGGDFGTANVDLGLTPAAASVDPVVYDIAAVVQEALDLGLTTVEVALMIPSGTSCPFFNGNGSGGADPALSVNFTPAVAPFDAATIHTDGTTLYLLFDNPAGGWDTQAFVGDETAVEVTVTRNGSPVVIAGVAASGTVGVAGFTEVSIELENPIYSGETVTGVTFPAGLVEDADGRTTEGGTDEAVTNNSTASSGGPDADVGRGRLQTLPRFRGSLAVR